MASTFIRSLNRSSLSSIKSSLSKSKAGVATAASATARSAAPSPTRRFSSFSRLPVELGCCSGSMFPLHSAVAAARLTSRLSSTSRSCRDLSQGTLCRTYPGL